MLMWWADVYASCTTHADLPIVPQFLHMSMLTLLSTVVMPKLSSSTHHAVN